MDNQSKFRGQVSVTWVSKADKRNDYSNKAYKDAILALAPKKTDKIMFTLVDPSNGEKVWTTLSHSDFIKFANNGFSYEDLDGVKGSKDNTMYSEFNRDTDIGISHVK